MSLDVYAISLEHPAFIEANAGTGKSFTLTLLYLRLLLGVGCKPIDYQKLLVLTFTKHATEELKQRITLVLTQLLTIIKQNRTDFSEVFAILVRIKFPSDFKEDMAMLSEKGLSNYEARRRPSKAGEK